MSKKRNIGSEEGVSGQGAAPAREKRKRLKTPTAPATPSVDIPAVASPEPATGTLALETAAGTAETAANDTPEIDEIARLAYSYWEARGRQGGSPEEDWVRAEHEVRQLRSLGAKA